MADTALLPGEILAISGKAADRLLGAGDGDAALLYLWLLRHSGQYDARAAAHALKWDGERAQRAFSALVGLKLADEGRQSQPAPALEPAGPPDYTAADITQELENRASPFSALVGEVQRRLGKVLSTADLKTLLSIYDYLALPAEVILLLVNWCVEEMERKYGPGRKPRMSQIRREAQVWQRLGLDTPEAAEAHLKKQAAMRTQEARILPLLDIRGRPPVEAERRYINAWVELGFADDAIRLAYERTVLKKQSLNWPYMNSILKSWHQKGLHTAAAVAASDSVYKGGTGIAPAPAPTPPGAADRRAREDMEQLRQLMRRQREEG